MSASMAAYSDDAIGGSHGDASVTQDFATFFGERDMSSIALEQTHTEVFLELAQLDAQRGLSDGATLRRTSEVETVG